MIEDTTGSYKLKKVTRTFKYSFLSNGPVYTRSYTYTYYTYVKISGLNSPKQVRDLLSKTSMMARYPGGSHYRAGVRTVKDHARLHGQEWEESRGIIYTSERANWWFKQLDYGVEYTDHAG
jgi:hypothetical protein